MRDSDFIEGKYSPSYYDDTLPKLIERAFNKALDWEKSAIACRDTNDFAGMGHAQRLMRSYLDEAAELEARLLKWKRFNHERI